MGKNWEIRTKNKIRNRSDLRKRRRNHEQCGVAHLDGVYAGLEQAFHFH